jgi:NADPH2:quinone reductase
VYASCVNYFDLLMLVGQYQFKPPLPFTLGSEASGRIVECGEGVKGWKVRDDVMVGMVMGGAMAEELIVPALQCLPKPPSFTWAEAAALPVGYYTAFNGLVQRGQLKKGEWLMVTGAGGGMGLAAVQLGQSTSHQPVTTQWEGSVRCHQL